MLFAVFVSNSLLSPFHQTVTLRARSGVFFIQVVTVD